MDESIDFLVSKPGDAPIRVRAPNWIAALGEGLKLLEINEPLRRLACEVLPNGTVLARNVATGAGFVVREAPDELDGPSDESDEDESTFDDFVPEMVDLTEELDSLDVLRDEALLKQLIDQVGLAESPVAAWSCALNVAQDLVVSEAASGLRLRGDGGLEFVAATGPNSGLLLAMAIPEGAGVVGFCAQRQVSVIVHDPATDPRFLSSVDDVTGYATRSLACAPVMADEVVGCLELLNAPQGTMFTRTHLELLEMVARALGERLASLETA